MERTKQIKKRKEGEKRMGLVQTKEEQRKDLVTSVMHCNVLEISFFK